jgi:hypothetical protein
LLADLWWARPYFNWDLIGYVGTAQSFTSDDAESIHRATFEDIARSVPDDTYTTLVRVGYRSAIAENPEQFAQQLPFYTIKPVYPVLMMLGSSLGYSLTASSVAISQIAFCLIAFLVFFWLSRHYAPALAFVATSLVVSLPFVLDLARYSTPDALSTLVILVACFSFAEGRRPGLAAGILVFSVLVRPDSALLAIVFSLVMWRQRLLGVVPFLAAVGATLLLTQLVSAYSGSYGWETLLHHGFIDRLEEPATTDVDIGIIDYLLILAGGSHPVSLRGTSYSFPLFVILSYLALRFTLIHRPASAARLQLLAAMTIFVIGRWLVFPGEAERTLAVFYVVVLLVLLIETQQLRVVSTPRARQAGET